MALFYTTQGQPRLSPVRSALISAAFYVTFCIIYIWISGSVAAQIANGDTELLARIERIKGTLFIIVSGLAFFIFTFLSLRRMHADAQTIQKQQQLLLTAERRAIAGMCSASLTHDLNNILTALGGLVDLLEDGQMTPASLPTLRKELSASIEELGDMSRRLSNVVKTSIPTERIRINIVAAVRQTIDLVRLHPDARDRVIEVSEATDAHALVNRSLFDQMLFNLLLNAAQATPRQGRVEVKVLKAEKQVVLQVHDNGPGLPPEMAERIFEPCFTTRPDGIGLGLLAVTAFTDLHGGTVTTGRSPLGGALFEVTFPAREGVVPPAPLH